MSQYLPRYMDADQVSITVGSGGITGGYPITTAGVAAGDAATDVAGVAGFDQASGGSVTVFREGLHTAVASGAVVLGDPLCTATTGRVRKWVAGTDAVAARIGRAWSAAADAGTVTYALINV